MKRKILLVILVFILIIPINAQEEKEYNFSFQTSPLFYLMDIINLGTKDGYSVILEFEFQYAINNYINISVSPDIYFRGYDNTNITQFIITPSLLYRPFQTRLKGMYIGAHVPIGFSNWKRESYTYTYKSYTYTENFEYQEYLIQETQPEKNDKLFLIGIGVSVGYQWILKNGFTISLGAGLQKIWPIESSDNTSSYNNIEHGTSLTLLTEPVPTIINFRIGYSF